MRVLILWALLLSTLSVQALEVYTSQAGSKSAHWTLLYNEDQKWVIETVELDGAGWPVLKSRHLFKNKTEARAVINPRVLGLTKSNSLPDESNELTGGKNESLWPVTNEWSWEWELKFSQWVSSELDGTWWLRHNLATDCADVTYSARWIFARNNGLPMANRLGNGQWFTHRSVKPEWKHLPTAVEWHKDKRFLAALNYMLDFVFTHSLWNDSYPIAINAASLIPGAHHLALTDTSGHTQFIYKVGLQPDQIPILTLNSTIPRKVRDLSEWLFFGEASENSAALLRMRWPRLNGSKPALVESAQMPHYSTEQFASGFIQAPRAQFWEEVFFRLNPNLDYDKVGVRALTQVLDLVVARVPIVEDGYRACAGGQCPEGGAAYELHSTPTRDERIASAIGVFTMMQPYVRQPDLMLPIFEKEILNQEGYIFNLGQIISAWNLRLFSSDPNVDPVLRWGIHPRAAAEKLISTYQNGLSSRETKITRGSKCKGTACEFGSLLYNQESTFTGDQELWQVGQLPKNYCRDFELKMCEDFRLRLRGLSLTAVGRTQNILDWLEDSFLFNSDPRHVNERRWFGYSQEIGHFVFQLPNLGSMIDRTPRVYDGKLILEFGTDFGSDRSLWSLNGTSYSKWIPPAGEIIANLDIRDGWIWTVHGSDLVARKVDSPQKFTFTIPSIFTVGEVFAGRAMVHLAQGEHLVLRVDAQGIVQESKMQFESAQSLGPGLTKLYSALDAHAWIYDQESGQLSALPPSLQSAQITRAPGMLLIEYPHSDGVSCATVTSQGTTVLNEEGHCLRVLPSGVAAFVIDSQVKIRTYIDWRVSDERIAGSFENVMGNVIKIMTSNGKKATLCAKSSGFEELPMLPAQHQYYECNDRYAISSLAGREWRAIDLTTNQSVLEASGWILLASSHDREHMVIARSDEDGQNALIDLDHPEKYSFLTDASLWGLDTPYERKDGLMILKFGVAIYLKTAL